MSDLALTDLISNWLCENMPEWKVVVPSKDEEENDFWYPRDSIGCITYQDGIHYTVAHIYPTRVEFIYNYGSSSGLDTQDKGVMERGLILDAHSTNFLPLLSNRLYMMGRGFKAAVDTRERNRHTNNPGVSH